MMASMGTMSSTSASWGFTPFALSSCTWAELSQCPGNICTSSRISTAALGSLSLAPAPAARSRLARLQPINALTLIRLSIESPPLRPVRRSQPHDLLQQLLVPYPSRPCRFCEILGSLEVRIGIGLEHVHGAVRPHAEIHAGIARQPQRAIDPTRKFVEISEHGRRKILRGARRDAVLGLVTLVPFDLAGGDGRQRIGHRAEHHLPDRQAREPVIPHDTDVQFASLDELLDQRIRSDLRVNELDALCELGGVIHHRGLRDTERGVLRGRLHKQGELLLARHEEPGTARGVEELGSWNAVERLQLFAL